MHRLVIRKRRDGGFTLVEALVVMVIMGVLAGIAIPVFLDQQQRVFRVVMVSDLATLRLAQGSIFTEDSDYSQDLARLRDEGYAQSDGVDVAWVETFQASGDPEYVACVKHGKVEQWLVDDSRGGDTSYADDRCGAP